MQLRKPLVFLAIAVVVSLVICWNWKPVSYAEGLIHIQAEQYLGPIDKRILNEPLLIQGQLLDYVDNRELVLKAWIALAKYPNMTRQVLVDYGSEAEFKEVLLKHGESVIPVIQYFRENDLWLLKAQDATGKRIQSISEYVKGLWGQLTGNEQPPNAVVQKKLRELGPKERGWYAINFIKQEGHDLLGQFVVTKDKEVKRIQTDRSLKAVTSFFTSGIRSLETNYKLDEETTSDWFWALLDVPLIAPAAKVVMGTGKVVVETGKVAAGAGKVLKAGSVATRSSEELSLMTRTRMFAPRLIPRSSVLQKIGRYGAAVVTAYIVITNPSLINSILTEVAKFLGLNPLLVLFVGWVLIIVLMLYPFTWLLVPLVRFVSSALSWLQHSQREPLPKNVPAKPVSNTVGKVFFCQLDACCRYCKLNRPIKAPLAVSGATT